MTATRETPREAPPTPETADIAGLVEELSAWGPLVASGYECPAASKAMHRAATALQSLSAELAEAKRKNERLQQRVHDLTDERDNLSTIAATEIDDVAGAELDDLEARATAAEAEARAMREALPDDEKWQLLLAAVENLRGGSSDPERRVEAAWRIAGNLSKWADAIDAARRALGGSNAE